MGMLMNFLGSVNVLYLRCTIFGVILIFCYLEWIWFTVVLLPIQNYLHDCILFIAINRPDMIVGIINNMGILLCSLSIDCKLISWCSSFAAWPFHKKFRCWCFHQRDHARYRFKWNTLCMHALFSSTGRIETHNTIL